MATDPDVPWTLATDLVPDIVADLPDVTGDEAAHIEAHALELAERYQLHEISSGKAPATIAASCIYVACLINEVRTSQGRIAAAADIAEPCIRGCYRDIFREEETDLSQIPRYTGPRKRRTTQPEKSPLDRIAQKFFGGDADGE